jgi:hypothetical protein
LKPETVRSHDLVFHFTWVPAKTGPKWWYFIGNLQHHPLIQTAADVGIDITGNVTLFGVFSGLTDSGTTIFYLAGEEANTNSHTTYHQLLIANADDLHLAATKAPSMAQNTRVHLLCRTIMSQ